MWEWLGWCVAAAVAFLAVLWRQRPRQRPPLSPESRRADAVVQEAAREQRAAAAKARAHEDEAERLTRAAEAERTRPMTRSEAAADYEQGLEDYRRRQRRGGGALAVLLYLAPAPTLAEPPTVYHPETGEAGWWVPEGYMTELRALERSEPDQVTALEQCRLAKAARRDAAAALVALEQAHLEVRRIERERAAKAERRTAAWLRWRPMRVGLGVGAGLVAAGLALWVVASERVP